MKAVILAGGLGTRLAEETSVRPKPMVEIGGRPLLWHILKIYSTHGIDDFVICLGFKGYVIKEYFANYFLHHSDVTFDLSSNSMRIHTTASEPWRVTLVDTGEETMTGGRVKRIQPFVEGQEAFCLTYGDGIGDVDITRLLAFHRAQGTLCTLTAAQPPGRFGAITLREDRVVTFVEKPPGDGAWVNAGFFVCSPRVTEYIAGDHMPWEVDPLENLARDGQLSVYRHRGFWQPVDTLRDKKALEEIWATGQAPWKTW